jgi:hypothetical protein
MLARDAIRLFDIDLTAAGNFDLGHIRVETDQGYVVAILIIVFDFDLSALDVDNPIAHGLPMVIFWTQPKLE